MTHFLGAQISPFLQVIDIANFFEMREKSFWLVPGLLVNKQERSGRVTWEQSC
jgi:hypothetical protein